MAYSPLSLGEIVQQAGAIKGQQQRQALGDIALQNAQTEQSNNQGIQSTLATNPNATSTDFAKYGPQGLDAYGKLSDSKVADLTNHLKEQYIRSGIVAASEDPVTAARQYAPEFVAHYDQVHGPGSFDKLTPDQVKQGAIQMNQQSLSGLQDPQKAAQDAFEATQNHYKQQGTGGELQRKQMEIDAANKREQYSQGQQNARDVKPVQNADGTVTYVPANQAAGKNVGSASAAVAGSVTDQAKELAYQTFKTTGAMPAIGRGGAATQAMYANYFAQRAAQDGDTGASIAAKGQAFKAQQGVLKDYTSGATSKTLNGINTAVAHMEYLDPLIDKLDNTGSPLFNKAANFFKQQTGSTAPTNFAAMKEFVAGEVAKAVLPSGGGEGERQALGAPLAAANTPAQLKEAVQTIKTALAGKTEALRNQWDIGTAGSQGSFDKFLLPATKKALGTTGGQSTPVAVAHPPDIQSLLDKYK